MRALLIVCSYHHRNTEKVAASMAAALGGTLAKPSEVRPDDVPGYDLVGFGSGIYGSRHHESLLELAARLPPVRGGKTFIFSTNGSPDMVQGNVERDRRTGRELEPYPTRVHQPLRDVLISKGYEIIGEFACQGHNTNSFLKLFGGINKGRPNADDLRRAEEFAHGLARKMERIPSPDTIKS